MAVEKEEFHFPDEVEDTKTEAEFEIEIEDDTPEEDRGRTPADPEKVKKLEIEVDDLDKYSKEAKDKIIRMKRVYHDERRAKESADRERNAALEAMQKLYTENKRIREYINVNAADYISTMKSAQKAQIDAAKRAYKDAYEAGDTDAVLEAQEKLTQLQLRLDQTENFRPPALQEDNFDVQNFQPVQQPAVPRPDDRALEWQSENPWFGQDQEMTASALGLHDKLRTQGVAVGSEEYYATLDKTMRRRFPEYFDSGGLEGEGGNRSKEDSPRRKPSTVVAPATRSTAPKRVRLTQSQVQIIKKLGITPEQYVREILRTEA
jgi:hypothetical protein